MNLCPYAVLSRVLWRQHYSPFGIYRADAAHLLPKTSFPRMIKPLLSYDPMQVKEGVT